MIEQCVGCGAHVDVIAGPVHRYMTSAPGCWALFGERLAVLSSDPRLGEALLLCTDAYAVQHPGANNPQAVQSVAVHLLNMRRYQVAGQPVRPPKLAQHHLAYRWLEPPLRRAALTVADMVVAGSPDTLTAAARAWNTAVWTAWAAHHPVIARWAAECAR